MSGIEIGVLGFGVMLLMLGLRMPIGAAMFLDGGRRLRRCWPAAGGPAGTRCSTT